MLIWELWSRQKWCASSHNTGQVCPNSPVHPGFLSHWMHVQPGRTENPAGLWPSGLGLDLPDIGSSLVNRSFLMLSRTSLCHCGGVAPQLQWVGVGSSRVRRFGGSGDRTSAPVTQKQTNGRKACYSRHYFHCCLLFSCNVCVSGLKKKSLETLAPCLFPSYCQLHCG